MIALQSLDRTNSQLAPLRSRSPPAIAWLTPRMTVLPMRWHSRAFTVGALTSANQQLGTVQGLLSTTNRALNDVSNTMASMRDVLVKLSDGRVRDSADPVHQSQYSSLLANVKTFIQDAGYNGKTLIGNITGSTGTFGRVATVRNETAPPMASRRSAAQNYITRSASASAGPRMAQPQGWPP